MKKFISFAVLTLILLNVNAQLSYGPKLAVNLATQSWKGGGSEEYKTGLLPGIQLGVFGNFGINENFSAQAELLYSMEGTRQKDKESGNSGNLRFNYLRLPFLGQYRTGNGFYAETGPSIGFVLAASQKWEGEKTKMDGYKSIDFGWNFGAGYDLSAFVEGLSAGARFYLGLANVIDRNNNGGNVFKNRGISISAQYTLHQ